MEKKSGGGRGVVRAKPKCLVTTAIVAATAAAEALHHGAAAAVMPELRSGEEDQVRRPSVSPSLLVLAHHRALPTFSKPNDIILSATSHIVEP